MCIIEERNASSVLCSYYFFRVVVVLFHHACSMIELKLIFISIIFININLDSREIFREIDYCVLEKE